jgi:hypothetical protein
MRQRTNRIVLGVVLGMLAALAVAGPAQAAPATLSQEQVQNETTNRSTVRSASAYGVDFELRAGYYQGTQYGWARITPADPWQTNDVLTLEYGNAAANSWSVGWYIINGDASANGWGHTGGLVTQADPNYNFRACLQRPGQGARVCSGAW